MRGFSVTTKDSTIFFIRNENNKWVKLFSTEIHVQYEPNHVFDFCGNIYRIMEIFPVSYDKEGNVSRGYGVALSSVTNKWKDLH